MTEYDEYAAKSGLSPTSLKDAVTKRGRDSVLTVHHKLYWFAKAVCREAYGDDFYSSVGLEIDGKGLLEKYAWQLRDR